MHTDKEITLIGAGLAGSLLSIFLARRGLQVTVYERQPDMRHHDIAAGRSINLALAQRGIRPLKEAGIFEQVSKLLIPMRGRMLHDEQGHTTLTPYGRKSTEVIHSISRPGLNRLLMNAAQAAGANILFQQRCEDMDFENSTLTLSDQSGKQYSINAHSVIATDGGGSTLRQALVKRLGVNVVEDILPHGYKELAINAGADGHHRLDREALHIWPRGGYMLIALPNLDGSFTVTLFLPMQGDPSFASLDKPRAVLKFFEKNFPDALQLLPNLENEFFAHPIGFMGTVHCARWHADGKLLLLGDAAHAIVPFHGQGMNCAFEDCLLLDRCLDKYGDDWQSIFSEFETLRRPDTEAIAEMALENYVEMRAMVRNSRFQLQKQLGFLLEERHPGIFVPRYSMVMFHHLPYSEARRRGAIQQRILDDLTADTTSLEQVDFERADALIDETLGTSRIEA
ncbi:MAG: NAD(P)/FAD-dependent oxidoreductase [Gammaproteobacteria bacterium]